MQNLSVVDLVAAWSGRMGTGRRVRCPHGHPDDPSAVATVGGVTYTVLSRRVANALIPGATATRPLRLLEVVLWPVRLVFGGLWVGGVAELRSDSLTFVPNSMNRAVHDGDLDLAVALRDVTSVAVKRGVVTRIITVAAGAATLVIRCYRADEFAEQIRAAVRAAG